MGINHPYSQWPYEKPKQRIWPWIATSFLAGLIGAIAGGYIVLSTFSIQAEPTVVKQAAPLEVASPTQLVAAESRTSVADVVAEISPAVVTVVNLRPASPAAEPDLIQVGSGSGVIIDYPGDQVYIVTNNHVVEGAAALQVVLANGDEIPAELLGVDEFTDLAVLSIEADMAISAELGNSDNLEPGESVIAIGSPLGTFNNSVTVGVVSALNRTLQRDQSFVIEDLIQTDAAINQGNSGGPLLNLDGEIVGINTFIVRGGGPGRTNAEGLGFAVPSNTVQAVADQIIQQGYVSYPFLGIQSAWITPPVAEANNLPVSYGVLVRSVSPFGPAAQAGIEAGDILTGINETEFSADTPFINQLFQYQPGDIVQINLLRGSESRSVQVELAERPEN